MGCLGISDGDDVDIYIEGTADTMSLVGKKMKGGELSQDDIRKLVQDITAKRVDRVGLAAFLAAIASNGLGFDEVHFLADAMAESGDSLTFDNAPVFGFHSLGGSLGNKVPILVALIVACADMTIPMGLSGAVRSSCGSSDIMKVFMNTGLSADDIRRTVKENNVSFFETTPIGICPAKERMDGILSVFDLSSRPQQTVATLAKERSTGITHLLVDIPVGRGPMIKTVDEGKAYSRELMDIGDRMGMTVSCALSTAYQSAGFTLGPNLEAKELLSILEGIQYSAGLIEKVCELSGMILEMGGITNGAAKAKEFLENGEALRKFRSVIECQGGNGDVCSDDIRPGKYVFEVKSQSSGRVRSVDNRALINIARFAGSPIDRGAGIRLVKRVDDPVSKGDVLFVIYADSEEKLSRAKGEAVRSRPFEVEGMIIKRITDVKVMG